jgi:hypothetical protein
VLRSGGCSVRSRYARRDRAPGAIRRIRPVVRGDHPSAPLRFHASAHRAPVFTRRQVSRLAIPGTIADHSGITHSRYRTALGGHQRTPTRSIPYSRGRRGSLSDTGGHGTDTVRDREAPGSNPWARTSVSNTTLSFQRLPDRLGGAAGHRMVTDERNYNQGGRYGRRQAVRC